MAKCQLACQCAKAGNTALKALESTGRDNFCTKIGMKCGETNGEEGVLPAHRAHNRMRGTIIVILKHIWNAKRHIMLRFE